MRRKPINVLYGNSTENGFILRIISPKDSSRILEKNIPGYYKDRRFEPKISNVIISFLLTVMIFIGCIFILFFVIDIQNIIIEIIGCCVAIFSSAYMFLAFLVFVYKSDREWHACEHKVVNLLQSSLVINEKNLKKASRINFRCGTFRACWIILLFVNYIVICWAYYSIESLSFYGLISQLFIFGVISIIFSAVFIALIFIIICPLMQYFLFTARPSEDKLEQSLELAKEIEKIVNKE